MDSRTYPQGKGQLFSKYESGVLVFRDAARTKLYSIDPRSGGDFLINDVALKDKAVRNIRTRFTIAQVNAGATLLAAVTGQKYRMVDAILIAVGGAVGAATTVDILGTQTTGVKLVAAAQAGLTQSTVVRAGDSTGAVLANGASFIACDSGTAITVGKTGSSVTTATHIDVLFSYVVEEA